MRRMPEGAGLSWSNVCKVYEGAQGATQALDLSLIHI